MRCVVIWTGGGDACCRRRAIFVRPGRVGLMSAELADQDVPLGPDETV